MNKRDYNIIRDVYDKCCTSRFPLPTEQRVREVEQVISAKVPEAYRSFLLEFNGGVFENAIAIPRKPIAAKWRDGIAVHDDLSIEILNGIDATFAFGMSSDYAVYENNSPLKLLPIGYAGAQGLLVLGMSGDIRDSVFVHFSYDIPIEIATNVVDFFRLIKYCEE